MGCPIVMGNLQNNPIAGFAVAAPGWERMLTASSTFSMVAMRPVPMGHGPAVLNFNLDGTTEGFTANGTYGYDAAQSLIIGGDFDKDGNPDIIATTQSANIYDIYHEPNPLNTPLNLDLLDGTNGGNVWQTDNTVGYIYCHY